MIRRLAALLVGGLALAAGPAVAAAHLMPTGAVLVGQADTSPGGDSSEAPAAPVPDPFIAEALKTCRDGASGDKGTLGRLKAAGWSVAVDGDTETPFYQSFSGEKDFDGVGTADITYSQEVYPTMTAGYCSISIDTALRHVGIADLAKMADLKGELRKTPQGVGSMWQTTGKGDKTYIQVDQHDADLYFILDVTTLIDRPAAELPYIQPPADSGSDTDNGPNPDLPDATNASD